MRAIAITVLLLVSGQLSAQVLYKCVGKGEAVSYQSSPCEPSAKLAKVYDATGVSGTSVAKCMAEFPGDRFVERLCRMPNTTMPEIREIKHMQVACDAMKAATEARGKTYVWVKLEFADGFKTSCYLNGYKPK